MSIDRYITVIDALHKRGEKTTIDSIREEAGGGSFSTIIAARRLWRARGITTHVQEAEMPPALAVAVGEIWRSACTLAESQLASERAALAAVRNEFEQSAVELCSTADSLADKVEQLTGEVSTLVSERDTLKSALVRMTAERDTYCGLVKETMADRRETKTQPVVQEGESDLPF